MPTEVEPSLQGKIERLAIPAAVVPAHPNRHLANDVPRQPRAKVGFLFQRDCTAAPNVPQTPTSSALPAAPSASTDRSWNKDLTASPGRTITSTLPANAKSESKSKHL